MSDKHDVVERRRACRHGLRTPLCLRVWGSAGLGRDAKSVDISAEGALLETDLPLRLGEILELRIKLPEEITGQPTTEWCCKSRVVRIAFASSVGYPLKVGVHFDWLDASRR